MPAGPGFVGLSGDTWSGVTKETAYGTQTGPTGAENFLFLSESLHSERPLVDVPNISAAFQEVTQTFLGAQVCSGDLELAMVYQGMENLLLHCFGATTPASIGSGTFTNTFDLTSRGRFRSSTSPSLSIHVSRGVVGSGATNPTVFTYTGCVVDSFQITGGRDQPLKIRISIFGRDEVIAAYSGSTSFPTAPIPNFTECVGTWGGTKIPITDFTITCNRNIDKARFFAGDTKTNEPPMGQYQVTGSLTTEWDNEKRVGASTLQQDYVNKTTRVLELGFLGPGIAGTAQRYMAKFQLNAALIATFPVSVSGRGRVTVPMTFRGYDSDVTTTPHELRLILQNARNFIDN
jgi:hypothetical protein